MKNISLIIFVLLVLVITTTSNLIADGRDEICVLNSATVKGTVVYLSDIAVVKSEGLGKTRLETLEVARYESQVTISVGTFEICQALSKAQINPASLDIFGAGACRVTFEGVATTEKTKELSQESRVVQTAGLEQLQLSNTLADELTKMVGQLASLDAERLRVDWYCTRKGFLEQAADEKRFKIVPRSTMKLGRVQFDVIDKHQADLNKTIQAGAVWQTGTVSVQGNVQYLCESVVATRSLRKGDKITLGDVKIVPQRVSSFRNVGVSDLSLVIGQEVARSISANIVIRPEMIRKVQIVKRKQTVTVQCKVGSVIVKVDGEAMGDGGLGDVIPVRMTGSKTIKDCTITGPGMVSVGRKADDMNVYRTNTSDVSGYAKKL